MVGLKRESPRITVTILYQLTLSKPKWHKLGGGRLHYGQSPEPIGLNGYDLVDGEHVARIGRRQRPLPGLYAAISEGNRFTCTSHNFNPWIMENKRA